MPGERRLLQGTPILWQVLFTCRHYRPFLCFGGSSIIVQPPDSNGAMLASCCQECCISIDCYPRYWMWIVNDCRICPVLAFQHTTAPLGHSTSEPPRKLFEHLHRVVVYVVTPPINRVASPTNRTLEHKPLRSKGSELVTVPSEASQSTIP